MRAVFRFFKCEVGSLRTHRGEVNDGPSYEEQGKVVLVLVGLIKTPPPGLVDVWDVWAM
jgi:hypothetical protein